MEYDARTALVVVDVQNDFAHPEGSLYVAGAEEAIAAANREIERAQGAGALVAYTQDWHPEHTPHFARDGGIWPVHCVAGSWGSRLHDDLLADPSAPRVRKGIGGEDGYSGFT
ncbi:MAG: isochorismatase family protein, partial [Chloroflexi bacterium]|nr:isochorismatase family protein [Chloroflexota bacterium]